MFKQFQHLSLSVLEELANFQDWKSQALLKIANSSLNSKQTRPRSDCFYRSSLIWVCTVCLAFGRKVVFEILVIYGKYFRSHPESYMTI